MKSREKTASTAKERFKKLLPYWFPIALGVIIAFWCIAYWFFIGWSLLTSLRSFTFFVLDPLKFPTEAYEWKLDNYALALSELKIETTVKGVTKEVNALGMVKNSLLYCLGNALWSNVTMCIATYVLSKYKRFPWARWLWTIYIITNFIPFNADGGSELKLQHTLGIYDSMVGNWIYNCGAFGANFLMYYGMWNSIPDTLMEAAEMDGANTWTIFEKIMFPQTIGLFIVVVLTKMNGMWDDYMPMIVQLPSYPSIASGVFKINGFSSNASISETTRIAALFILAIPMVILYFSMKGNILKSMSMAEGIKG